MNLPSSVPTPAQGSGQVSNTDPQYAAALQTSTELVRLQKRLGLEFIIYDKNLNKISVKFNSVKDLLKNPEFLSRLDQELYVSNEGNNTWLKLKIKNGKIAPITFLLTMQIDWVKITNKCFGDFDFFAVGYTPGVENAEHASTVIPRSDFTPDKIVYHFPPLIAQTAVDKKEIGKLICFILSKFLIKPTSDMLDYMSYKQGFSKCLNKEIIFNPVHLLRTEMRKYLPEGIKARQYPTSLNSSVKDDITLVLAPFFKHDVESQVFVLFRFASWHQSFFALNDVYADNALIVKSNKKFTVPLGVALLKNTRYDSLDAPSIGPNIKPLKFELENVNDGIVIAIDPYAADQVKKAEKGYDLIINDTMSSIGNSETVHHITALISEYADMYFPKEKCCIFKVEDISIEHSTEAYKIALKRLDADIVIRTEHDCNYGQFIEVFNNHVGEVKKSIPSTIPPSKHNIYIMLMTALRIYNEWFTPLFCPDIEQYIVDWLSSQEQDIQPLQDVICSEFGKILNRKIADGYFNLIPKEEVTPYDKGTHTIVIDKDERRIYIETADSFAIAQDEMTSVADTDSLTAALYNCEYLPHNAKNEKSIRIAAVTSDGTPYPLYVHAIKYTLLTQANRQRFELIDKDAFLFKYDEIPEGFLPLIKTADGRYAGKMLRYEDEENNVYFGTGRLGSGKSWAIAQLLPMLFMLGHTVVVFEVSDSYTKEKLLRMLPPEVVEKIFTFINVGEKKDPIPVNLGSLRGCETLPDKKRAIYSVLRAATGPLDKSVARKLKGFLSNYLKDKEGAVDLNDLCSALEEAGAFGSEIADRIESVIKEIEEIGYDEQIWDNLFSPERKIIVINLGNEVGDTTHQLLDVLVGSLFNWQMSHDTGFLSIVIDELIDQDFSIGSPLQTVVKQGRKFHTALIGATQDYYNQGSSHLDVMKQANIQNFCRPGKSEDRVAQKLGYSNAADAGFNKSKAGDTIAEFDGYNKETGQNEAITLKGRVVNFVETPLYEKFKEMYG